MVRWHHWLNGWVWVNSGSWWWTGRLGELQFMGSQRIGHDWATELMLILFFHGSQIGRRILAESLLLGNLGCFNNLKIQKQDMLKRPKDSYSERARLRYDLFKKERCFSEKFSQFIFWRLMLNILTVLYFALVREKLSHK